MKVFKLSLILFIGTFFIAGCNQIPLDGTSDSNPGPYSVEQGEADLYEDEDSRLARENLDLQAVAALLERASNPEEFEYLLNSENGVNNLDLNDDGYVDYISVSEFEDRGDNERGLSLFSRFGPDLIQEIATIIFDRDGFDSPGARILLAGNDDLYGDNYFYETNWLDRSLSLVNYLFEDRGESYESPYYYENYPSDYEAYSVVETPVYRSRIEQYYPAPMFVHTTAPTITEIEIKSPYHDRSADKFFSKSRKLTKEEKEFIKNNPNRPEIVPVRKGWTRDVSSKPDKKEKRNFKDFDKPRKGNNDFEKPRKEKFERPQMREKPNKIMRDNPKPQKQQKFEKQSMKPQKQDNSWKQKGNGNGGGGNKGGGKENKGGGGGKGGGKKN